MIAFLTRCDDWILARYQRVADWAYTLTGVSPYWIAAQMAGASALLNCLDTTWAIARMDAPLRTAYTAMAIAGMSLLANALWFHSAMEMHRSWSRGRPAMPIWSRGHLTFLRCLFAAMAGCCVVALGFDLILAVAATSTSFFYFISCSAPTNTGFWTRQIAPEPAA